MWLRVVSATSASHVPLDGVPVETFGSASCCGHEPDAVPTRRRAGGVARAASLLRAGGEAATPSTSGTSSCRSTAVVFLAPLRAARGRSAALGGQPANGAERDIAHRYGSGDSLRIPVGQGDCAAEVPSHLIVVRSTAATAARVGMCCSIVMWCNGGGCRSRSRSVSFGTPWMPNLDSDF